MKKYQFCSKFAALFACVMVTSILSLPLVAKAGDFVVGSWANGPTMLQAVGEARGAVLDGKFYVVAGRTGEHDNNHDYLQCYDPATSSWSMKAPLPQRSAAVGLAVSNGKLYCMGGLVANDSYWWGMPRTDVYSYDPSTNSWDSMASMPNARSNFVTTVMNGKIYCAGGNAHWPSASNKLDVYDIATNTWSTLADMPETSGGNMGGSYNGKVVSAMGLSDAWTQNNEVRSYNVATNTWSTPSTISPTFAAESGFLYSDDDGMYFAASNRPGAASEEWICRLHPDTGVVDWLSKAPDVRSNAAAAFDPFNNTIYLAGGYDSATGLDTIKFNYSIVTIPEPATVLLVGLGGLVLRRRK